MTDIEQANEFFKQDVFAIDTCGIKITKVGEISECQMPIKTKHLNALNSVMGGAIFTLADFTLAVALNYNKMPSVTTSANINFLSGAKGKTLIAQARPIRKGRTLSCYQVDVHDELNTHVAFLTMNGFRVSDTH